MSAATQPSEGMGMVGVVSPQLWYHTFINGRLADKPNSSMAGRLQPALV